MVKSAFPNQEIGRKHKVVRDGLGRTLSDHRISLREQGRSLFAAVDWALRVFWECPRS